MARDYMREEWANWQAVTAYMRQFKTIEEFLSASGPDANGTHFQDLIDDWAVSRVRIIGDVSDFRHDKQS